MLLKKNSFYRVNLSLWPITRAICIFCLFTLFFQFLMNELRFNCMFFSYLLRRTLFRTVCVFLGWFNDFLTESTFLGLHTRRVQLSIKIGFILFLLSEVMLFFAFFWRLFHSRLNPSTYIGAVWPPKGIVPLSASGIPLLNTRLLISSGIYLTTRHLCFLTKTTINSIYFTRRQSVFICARATCSAGFLFLLLQRFEYIHALFDISDSIYASTFYMLTGLHGMHVLFGLIFLLIRFIRFGFYHYTTAHALNLECAIWYWHFVDIIWIFLFVSIYIRL
jgi:cytochrome c oxidase subunit 3